MKNESGYDYFSQVPEWERGLLAPQKKTIIQIEDARTILENALKYFISFTDEKLTWLPEYDEVAEWLKDNNGKGLFLFGDCGRGKSLLTRLVLPAIIAKYCQVKLPVFEYWELNPNIDKIIGGRVSDDVYTPGEKQFCIDDAGPEADLNQFGNKRIAFAEIMDSVEKQSKLVIISSNLDKDGLLGRYGSRTYDRIIATTQRVKFSGESLRK